MAELPSLNTAVAAAITDSTMPQRRHVLTVKLGADSLHQLQGALEEVSRALRETGNESVTGGPQWGGVWSHLVTPEQTHENYHAEVKAWLASRKAATDAE